MPLLINLYNKYQTKKNIIKAIKSLTYLNLQEYDLNFISITKFNFFYSINSLKNSKAYLYYLIQTLFKPTSLFLIILSY